MEFVGRCHLGRVENRRGDVDHLHEFGANLTRFYLIGPVYDEGDLEAWLVEELFPADVAATVVAN